MNTMIFKKLQIVLLTALLLSGVSVHAGSVILKFRGEVEVTSNEVLLSDLVVNTADLSEEQQQYKIMNAPSIGEKHTFTLISLAYKLQNFPSLLKMKINGPDSVTIIHKADRKKLKAIKKKVTKALQQKAPWKLWKLDVKFELADERKLMSVGKFDRVELKATGSRKMLGPVPMRATFFDEDDNELHECSLSPKILREVSAVMMAESRPRGHNLTSSDLQVTQIWVGESNIRYLSDLKECVGKELSQRLEVGEMPQESNLLQATCAKRGDQVYVTCQTGNLTIQVTATALQNGRKGDIIQVENKISRKILRVELTGLKNASMKL